jgi:hypothetical protein
MTDGSTVRLAFAFGAHIVRSAPVLAVLTNGIGNSITTLSSFPVFQLRMRTRSSSLAAHQHVLL